MLAGRGVGIAGRGIRSGRGAETVLGAFGVDLMFSAFGASTLCCDDLLGGVQLRVVAGGEGVTFTDRPDNLARWVKQPERLERLPGLRQRTSPRHRQRRQIP